MEISDIELSSIISAAIAMRKEASVAPSLQDLCMRSIAENEHFFVEAAFKENILKYLPASMSKAFLRFLHAARLEQRKFASKVYLDLILLLLNEQTTEFDFNILPHFVNPENEPFEKIKMASVTLHHLQKHCPKINRLHMYWPRNFQLHLPWHNLRKWKGLKFLGIKDFICDASTLNIILKNHPLLEGLELSIQISELSTECVGFLSEMKNLQYLSVSVNKSGGYQDPRDPDIPTVMANIAAKVPKLSTFHFHCNISHHPAAYPDGFVEKYATLCRNPDKVIKLLDLELKKLECEWPSNLTVDKLVVFGVEIDMATIKNLQTAATKAKVKSLVLVDIKTGTIYKLLRIFGPTLNQLGIDYLFPKDLDRNLSIFKIISYCPNLEKLYTDEFASQKMDSDCILTPANFAKWKSFWIYIHHYENIYLTDRPTLRQVFKMFLLGSQNLEPKLHIFIGEFLLAAVEAMEEDPECLKHLKELHMDVQWTGQLNTMFKVGKMVMQRAPFVERIKIGTGDGVSDKRLPGEVPKWFSDMAEALGVGIEIQGVYRRPQYYEIYSDYELLHKDASVY